MKDKIISFFKYLEFLGRMLLGRPITVSPVPGSEAPDAQDRDDLDLGYTNKSGTICVAWEHPLMKGMSAKEKEWFRLGVFAHELLHQLLTDFEALEHALEDTKSETERKMIQTFANLVEDPAIEYFAPVPRLLQHALRYVIDWTFYRAPALETGKTPLCQLINALVMYGDTGRLKGKFTFPEAEEYFKKIKPEFLMEVYDADASFRPLCARSWAELVRPLWEEDEKTEEEMKEQMKALADLLKQLGKSLSAGSGAPKSDPAEPSPEKRREMHGRLTECFGESFGEEEDDENDKGGKSDEKSDGKSDGSGEAPDGDETKDDGSAKDGKGAADGKALTVVLRPSLDKEAEDCLKKIDEAIADIEKSMKPAATKLPTYRGEVAGGDDRSITVNNTPVMDQVTDRDRAIYKNLRARLGNTPQALAKVLRELMRRHMTQTFHSSHGRLNVRRWASGMSQFVFDKRVTEKNAGGTRIFLIIDLSGSMHGTGKIDAARDVAIIFAETCHMLKIPITIMGYTAELGSGRTLDHFHYVRNGTEKERVSLAKIEAMCENADGYSFRYMEQDIIQSKADKKIVLILTDGYPAAPAFYGRGGRDGFKDTRDAFNRLKKSADGVFAFGLGTYEEQMKKIYGNSFVQVNDVSKLPQIVANRFKTFW